MQLSGHIVGNYSVGAVLGRGGMGTVYRATSVADGPAGPAGSVVALKVFDPELVGDERVFERFKREAELGIRIVNAHVVKSFEIGNVELEDGSPCHFMAMELIEGQNLREAIAELGTLPEHLVYQIADQALDALAAVHAHGMIHRDVKPDNLVLTHEQTLKLMDLGVARLQQEGRDLTRAGEFVGSLPYAAPEQFTDQDHVGPLADLYAFGVVLYEISTGRNPFPALDLSQLLQSKLTSSVRRPRLVARDLDPFLDEVIMTCLRAAPHERFADAGALRSILKLGEESEWWQARIEGEAFPAGARALQRLKVPREARLIGRRDHLEVLHDRFEQGGGAALVRGRAGTGKSRLLHDFIEDLVVCDGPVVLAARCPFEPDRPFEAVFDALGCLGADEARLRELAGDAGARLLSGDPDKDTFVAATTGVLKGLSATGRVVIVLDDLHLAGPETVELFAHLARETGALLVGSFRDEAVDDDPTLLELTTAGHTTVALSNFTTADVDVLLRDIAHDERTVRALARPLLARSDGNPAIVLEMLAQLRADGGLVERDDGLELSAPLEKFALPQTIAELFRRRLDAVDDALWPTLEAAAVAGPEFRSSLVGALTGQRRIGLLKKLAELERKHRFIESSGKALFRFAGQGLHEFIYESIPEDRRTELHTACADAIREEYEDAELPPDAAFALVRHQLKGKRLSATDPAVTAALQHASEALHPLTGAAFLYELIPSLDDVLVRFDACLRLAELLRLLGEEVRQRKIFARATAEAAKIEEKGPHARLHAAFSRSAIGRGQYERAETEAQRGHWLACKAGDRQAEAQCLHLLGTAAYKRGRLKECGEYWRDALHVRREIGDRRGEAATLQALGLAMRETGEIDEALQSKRAALDILREIGDRRGEGAALNNLANSMVDLQQVDEALVCYEQAIRISRDLGDLPTEAAAQLNRGRGLAVLARIEEAKESFQRALDLFRMLGDPGGAAEVLDEMGSSIAAYGERKEALENLLEAQAAAEQTGATVLLSRVLRHLANVQHEDGEVDAAWENYNRALALSSPHGRSQTLADMGNAALREGDGARAVELLERGMESVTSGGRALLSLCRLARAHKLNDDEAQAEACARRAERFIGEQRAVAPQYAPEIYYSLGTVLSGTERGDQYLETANELLGNRTRSIRSVVHRQHYLTMTWPNREILEEARRLMET